MVGRMAFLVAMGLLGAAVFGAEPATRPATHPATMTSPATTAAATEPASPLYTEFMTQYMNGDWAALDAGLKDKGAQISGLTKDEQADIKDIQRSLKEGRPDWWAAAKTGVKANISVVIWGHKVTVAFDPAVRWGVSVKMVKGAQVLSAGWLNSDMDSKESAGIQIGGKPLSFTKGDLVHLTAWANLANVESQAQMPPTTDEIARDRYLELRGKLTGMVFGSPPARRYGLWLCLKSFTEENPKPAIRMAQRAIGELFIGEVLEHPENYPSVELPKKVPGEKSEEVLGLALADWVATHPFTYAGDNALKAALRPFAVANGKKVYTTGVVTLPNKLTMPLDPRKDGTSLLERNAWINSALEKPQGEVRELIRRFRL